MFVVSGVSGHVGSVVATELLGAGQKIRVVVRDASKGEPWAGRGAEVSVGQLDDEAFMTNALRGASGFFTLLPDKVPGDFHASQRAMGESIARAVRASGVPHVVMLSSLGADLPSGTGVLVGLHHFENALRETGATVTAIRATALQENVANAFRPAEAAGIYASFYPSEDYRVSMVATKDVGKLAAKSLLEPATKSEIVDIEGPLYSSREIADKLGASLGKKLAVVTIAPHAQVEALMRGGVPRTGAEGLSEMYSAVVAGRIAPHGDRLVMGTTPLDEFLSAHRPTQ